MLPHNYETGLLRGRFRIILSNLAINARESNNKSILFNFSFGKPLLIRCYFTKTIQEMDPHLRYSFVKKTCRPGLHPNAISRTGSCLFGLYGLLPFGLFWTTRTFGLSPFGILRQPD